MTTMDAASTISMMLPMLLMKAGDNSENNINKMLTSILIVIVTALLNQFAKDFTFASLKSYFRGFRSKQTVYELKGTLTYRNYSFDSENMPLPFTAVMHHLYKTIINDKDCKIEYNVVDEVLWGSRPYKIVMFTKKDASYELTDNILMKQEFTDNTSEKGEFKCKEYKLKLLSKTNNTNDIVTFIQQTVDAYDEEQSTKMNKLKIFTLTNFDKELSSGIKYSELEFKTTKSFDNMFFEEKELLKNKVDMFEYKNVERYERLGIPRTLGMMFHGEPGTGKTSAIKALAKYTERHIVIVPVKKINTADQLQKVFLNERINGIKVPMSKRLYVFEEIDCSQWKSIVTARQYQNQQQREAEALDNKQANRMDELAELMMVAMDPNATEPLKCKKDTQFDLTLGDILELLDGMVEMPNRMIIMTTNHPEHLDPALLRPGRIDLLIRFKKLTRQNILDMYKLWFDTEVPFQYAAKIKDYTFSQAELGNLFSTYDHQHILETLAK